MSLAAAALSLSGAQTAAGTQCANCNLIVCRFLVVVVVALSSTEETLSGVRHFSIISFSATVFHSFIPKFGFKFWT